MTSDLAETIARWKERNEWLLKHSPTFHPTIKLSINDQLDLAALINAAESGIAANKVIAETNDRAREAAEELARRERRRRVHAGPAKFRFHFVGFLADLGEHMARHPSYSSIWIVVATFERANNILKREGQTRSTVR